jgi:uncharacterized protein DUF2510
MGTASPAPGWYQDPEAPNAFRYWDGAAWTDHVTSKQHERAAGDGGSGADSPAPDWHPDPTGRHAMRYWDGSTWTQHVAAADGTTGTDRLATPMPDDGQEPNSPEQEVDQLHERLERAMSEYGSLLQEAATEDMDDATFSRRALRIGLIVRDRDAWLLDLSSRRWFRYDGISLSQVGAGTASGPDQEGG